MDLYDLERSAKKFHDANVGRFIHHEKEPKIRITLMAEFAASVLAGEAEQIKKDTLTQAIGASNLLARGHYEGSEFIVHEVVADKVSMARERE